MKLYYKTIGWSRAPSDQFSNAISTKTEKKGEKRKKKLHKIEYFILIILMNFIITRRTNRCLIVHTRVPSVCLNIWYGTSWFLIHPIFIVFRASKYQKASQKHRVVNIDGEEWRKKCSSLFSRSQYSFSFYSLSYPFSFTSTPLFQKKDLFLLSILIILSQWLVTFVRSFIFDFYIWQFIVANDTPKRTDKVFVSHGKQKFAFHLHTQLLTTRHKYAYHGNYNCNN